jgi:hypothetical protein
MQFLNECVAGLQVGVLAQFDDQGLITARTTGRIIGIVSKVFESAVSMDDPTLMHIAEITTHGYCLNVILQGSASWQGSDLYANGDRLTATVNGSPIAQLMPKTLGQDKVDFADGDLVTVVMI